MVISTTHHHRALVTGMIVSLARSLTEQRSGLGPPFLRSVASTSKPPSQALPRGGRSFFSSCTRNRPSPQRR